MQLTLNIPLVSDVQDEIMRTIQASFEKVMQLEAPAKPKLVGVDGAALAAGEGK